MARIDDLIAEIGDERVRRAVAVEVYERRDKKGELGLMLTNYKLLTLRGSKA